MGRPQDEIVFEDLHGVTDPESVTVDLDSDMRGEGIERHVADDEPDPEPQGDVQFDDLRPQDDEQDDEQDDDELKPEGDDDDDGYSRKVKKRINRETRAKKAAQDEAAYWKQQAESLARNQSSQEKADLEATVERSKAAITKAEEDLERAIEDGDTKEQVRLTGELTDLKADRVVAETTLQNLPSDVNLQPFDGNVQSESDTQEGGKKAADWVEERSDWYGQRGFERHTRLANRIDKEVFADGFDPNTEEYFQELDRRIKEKEPDLYDDEPKQRKQRRSPVAPVSGAETRQRKSGNKVELDENDFANMRRFNLDPNDPQVLKEYARNKRETLGGRR